MDLKELREKSGLTQRNVGLLLEVDQAAISNWERGVNKPSRKYLRKLAKLYGVTVDELLSEQDTA